MAEFKLNEEQVNLMKKFSNDANALIEKYSRINEAFGIIANNIRKKLNSCDDERLKEVKEETERLQGLISDVRRELGKINYLANGYDGYESAASLLLKVQCLINDVMYELGKLEGYSSGDISTFGDICTLKRNYEALKKSLLE